MEKFLSKTPIGWVYTNIGETSLEIISGSGFPKIHQGCEQGKYPFAKVGDISKRFRKGDKFIDSAQHYISEEVRKIIKARVFSEGTIVLPKIGEALKGNYRIITKGRMLFDNNVMGILHASGVNVSFLYYFLLTKDFGEFSVATAVPSIRRGDVEAISFMLPPTEEQNRIVSKIEELFSELDKGIESLKTAREQLQIYRQALLKHAFEGKLTEQWRKDNAEQLETADQLLEQIKQEREDHYQQQLDDWKKAVKQWEDNGKEGKKPIRLTKPKLISVGNSNSQEKLPSSWLWSNFCSVTYKIGDIDHKMPKDSEEGIPYLSTGNLKSNGSIDFFNAKIISEEDYQRLSVKIKPERGDIIFPRYGTIGRNFLIDFDKEFLVSYSCAIIKNITSLMNEKYIYYFSLSPVVKKEIKRYVKETTQANIGIASIEMFVFPLCSYEEQSKIVGIVESYLSVLDENNKLINDSLLRAESLRQSILKKAFSGNLVPQDPNDEPASELLKRIAQEKAELEVQEKAAKVAIKKSKPKTKKKKILSIGNSK
jgi:type I restriction enzyme S subunit